MAAKVMHPQKEIDVERRKWTVGTSLTTLAIAIALAVASIAAAKTISQPTRRGTRAGGQPA